MVERKKVVTIDMLCASTDTDPPLRLSSLLGVSVERRERINPLRGERQPGLQSPQNLTKVHETPLHLVAPVHVFKTPLM